MKLSPVFIILVTVVATILFVELPKRQKSLPEIVEQDYSTPECLHDECFRDTPSADELNAILFPGHGH